MDMERVNAVNENRKCMTISMARLSSIELDPPLEQFVYMEAIHDYRSTIE